MATFKKGYETFSRLTGVSSGANSGAAYVENVNIEIEKLVEAMNEPTRKIDKSSIDSVKGFVAEWWHEHTFNIEAALKGSKIRASAPDDNGIVDIVLNSGEEYQTKYYRNGVESAKEQAKTNLQRYKEYVSNYRRKHNGQDPTNMLFRVPSVFFQEVFHIDYVGFDKVREAHIQAALFLEKLFALPFLCFPFGGKSALLRLLYHTAPIGVAINNAPSVGFSVLVN